MTNNDSIMKRATLGTGITFKVLDLRGTQGFPMSPEGLVYEHCEKRIIHDKYTGDPIKRDERYVIRTDYMGKGWRVDRLPKYGPAEAVYGAGRQEYFEAPEVAAKALVAYLDEVRDNSTLASF